MCTKTQKIVRLAFSLSVSFMAACGGGTTGTSPTSGLKFLGTARSADGVTISDTPMSVFSGESDETLLDSQTDASGGFSMELPVSESSIGIEVDQRRSPVIMRAFQGASSVSTTMVLDPDGNPSFRNTTEARVRETDLCPAFSTDGNTIVQTEEFVGDDCNVTIDIASSDLAIQQFALEVRASCGDEPYVPIYHQIDGGSSISVDLVYELSRTCRDIRVIVSSTESDMRPIEFPIVTKDRVS